MATLLQQQLAEIAANSTHQLDLKAQKAQHSQSLLFEPSDAARQSFDDIYQICREGFDELCQLDSRFLTFANNLFHHDRSSSLDRGQLTNQENSELDRVIERFLGLVQGRVLLKPAQKSLEWLVRRLKAQDFNTEALLLTFLPYHAHRDLFPALLAIIPAHRELPESFKWLHPYIASCSCPPGHAVLAAAISSRPFFAAFNAYTLRVAQAGHSSSVPLAFWTKLVAQAVNGMLDAAKSGRDSVRRQREEEILLNILPALRDAFQISKKLSLDEMYVGICMIVIVLATKADLSDNTLDALMTTVASAWADRTAIEGLSCLATLAEEKEEVTIPPAVAQLMLKTSLFSSMERLASSQRVSKLVAAFSIEVLQSVAETGNTNHLNLLHQIFQAGLLQQEQTSAIFDTTRAIIDGSNNSVLRQQLSKTVTVFTETAVGQAFADRAVRKGVTGEVFDDSNAHATDIAMDDSPATIEAGEAPGPVDITKMLDELPQLPNPKYSFFNPTREAFDPFKAFAGVFREALSSEQSLQLFLDQALLRGSGVSPNPALLSFLARLWATGPPLVHTRVQVKALEILIHEISTSINWTERGKDPLVDLQALIPYLWTALSNDNQNVRRAVAKLCVTIFKLSENLNLYNPERSGPRELNHGERSSESEGQVSWLSAADSQNLFNDCLIPALDDCRLNADYLRLAMVGIISGKALSNTDEKKLKGLNKDQRAAVANFIASQVVATPVLRTKLCLLRILERVHKTAASARPRYLLPFFRWWISQPEDQLRSSLAEEGISLHDMDRALLANVWQCSGEAHETVRSLCISSDRRGIIEAAFEQQQQSWPALKSKEIQLQVLQWLLGLALAEISNNEQVVELALQTVRSLEISSEALVAVLEAIPKTADLREQSPVQKKQRRTVESERTPPVNPKILQQAIHRITLVLELVEASKPQAPELLRPLFQVLAELRQLKSMAGSDLVYLHTTVLDALHSIVESLQGKRDAAKLADTNSIRTDLLIECVRSSSSPQVQNSALLLIAVLASWLPETVLHSVMPLFTFMSTTILQRNDEYSNHITEQTIARIVPSLARALNTKGQNVLVGVSEMLLSFVAAWEHIPLHRRLQTFQMIIDAVGIKECLGAISAMLAERYLQEDKSVSRFLVDMIGQYSAVSIIEAADQWLGLITQCLQAHQSLKQHAVSAPNALFALSEKDEDEKKKTFEALLLGLRSLVRHDDTKASLITSLAQSSPDDLQRAHTAYASLLENATQLTQDFLDAKLPANEAANQVLSAVLDLLPTPDFIASSAKIMQQGSDLSREMVFQSLESRVHASRPGNAAESEVFIDLLPSCAAFIRPDQSADVTAAAIGCVDAICEKFGKISPETVRDTAGKVAGPDGLGSNNDRLRTLSLLCLASVAGVLEYGDDSLSIFPKVLESTLDYLSISVTKAATHENVGVQEAAFRLLVAFLDHIPGMLTTAPKDLDRALKLTTKTRNRDSEAVNDFLRLAAKKTSAAVLIQSIERIWIAEIHELDTDKRVSKLSSPQNFETLVQLFQQAIEANTKTTVTNAAPMIFRLFPEFFDLRRHINELVNNDETLGVGTIFAMIDQVVLEVTLKMNDATFRPFFIRLVEWATSSLSKDPAGRQQRMMSVYRFALLLFERLGALVIGYMSYLLESSCEVIRKLTVDPAGYELLEIVLGVLDTSFKSDEEDYWTAPAHFDAIAGPLIDRLRLSETHPGGDELAVQAISNLAAAVGGSPDQLKFINNALLALLRQQTANVNVKLAALQCQRSITGKVTFDWLALLPEMLPVISELQEDDDERVERETLMWAREIEEISGESLEAMLA